jgi:alpha-tubulin suppressor-like RCC1 family protein
VKGVCAGPSHIVAWTDKAVFKWGDSCSASEVVVDERVVQAGSGRYGTLLVTDMGKVLSLGPLKVVPMPELIRHVACGGRHAVLVSRSGVVFGLGSNDKVQLGVGQSMLSQPSVLALDLDGPVVSAAAGEDHTLLLLASGVVATLGSNAFGQLGVSSFLLATQAGVFFPVLPRASSVCCGSFRSACICEGNAYVWGRLASANMMEHSFAPQMLHVEDCPTVFDIAVGSTHFAVLTHAKLNNQIRVAAESISNGSGGPPIGVSHLSLSPRSLLLVQNGALLRTSKFRLVLR